MPPRVPESDVPSGLDAAIANGTLSGNSDMNWKGNYRLYRKMLRHPSIENYAPVYTAFKTAQSTVSSGRLAYIAEERAKLFTLSSADQATDINYRTSIAQQANSLRVLDSLLQADAPVNVAQYNALVQQKASNELNYTSFLEDKVATRLLQIQNLLSLNDAISTPQTCAYNHKTVNSIVLNTLANDDIEISAANLATLTTIAGQCPVAGGDAVYEARAIVEQLTGQIFDDAALCAAGPTQHRNEDGTNEAVNITLYPNPTTGLLQWTGTEGQVVTFQVFDQLGVLVKEQKADNPQVDLSLLPNGLYFVRMTSSDGTLLVDQKVLLMKS